MKIILICLLILGGYSVSVAGDIDPICFDKDCYRNVIVYSMCKESISFGPVKAIIVRDNQNNPIYLKIIGSEYKTVIPWSQIDMIEFIKWR